MGIALAAALGALAFEGLSRLHRRQQRAALADDLRTFAAILDRFAADKKTPGPASPEGALPSAVQAALKETNWSRGSPFGGSYEWVPARSAPVASAASKPPAPSPRLSGAIAVTAFAPAFPLTATRADLLAIDAELDDGNLATGRFRTGFNGWPVYQVGAP